MCINMSLHLSSQESVLKFHSTAHRLKMFCQLFLSSLICSLVLCGPFHSTVEYISLEPEIPLSWVFTFFYISNVAHCSEQRRQGVWNRHSGSEVMKLS